ncbi:putative defensin-like protein 20-27 [Arabidopsis thaliana]|uniref:Defensin-like protein 20-27 n=1 Tax=Arabidopsis thaliana x Arabidopsis arenosa TaxID=1240361 RepID=A0A8T2GM25_9BRAS|nr:Defensin-like protein 20-27 [Arabidopsis thaliana x Arabidopsis arenosa]
MASLKDFSFALLIVLTFSVIGMIYNVESGGSLCCNSHPKFGKCNTNNDEQRCNRWCHNGCGNGKGGYYKSMSHGGQCHYYC